MKKKQKQIKYVYIFIDFYISLKRVFVKLLYSQCMKDVGTRRKR